MQHVAPLEVFSLEQYDLMHRVMLRAPLRLSQLVIAEIKSHGDGTGVIGNMASIHAHICTRDKVAYNIVKFGLRGLTQSIAAEGQGKIRAFSVSTGYVKTPLVLGQIAPTAEHRGISHEAVVSDVMLGGARTKTMMSPIQVANLFVFAFSRYAQHLVGSDLLFDGGIVLTY
jgi:3-hydroxybutyrate dehydrogenase